MRIAEDQERCPVANLVKLEPRLTSLSLQQLLALCFSLCLFLFLFGWPTVHVAQGRKGTKIRNRYNQVPHLTQDTNRKVTNSQLDITNESQEVSPFPAGDHKASINKKTRTKAKQTQISYNMNDPQKKYRLGTVRKNILLEGLNQFHGTNPTLSSDMDQDT